MKKAGIITFHCADNFGAVLQAYALMKTIMNFNIDVEIIDFKPTEIIQSYSQFFDIKYSLKHHGILRTAKIFVIKIRDLKKNKTRNVNFQNFRNKYLNISDKIYKTGLDLLKDKPLYDFYITGSAQVWNPDFFYRLENPTMAVIQAENQILQTTKLAGKGVLLNLGYGEDMTKDVFINKLLTLDREKRKEMSKLGQVVVDGKGAERCFSRIIKEYYIKSEMQKSLRES